MWSRRPKHTALVALAIEIHETKPDVATEVNKTTDILQAMRRASFAPLVAVSRVKNNYKRKTRFYNISLNKI